MADGLDRHDLDLLNGLGHDAWSVDYPMPEQHQRELGQLVLRAWREVWDLRTIAANFAAIDPTPEGTLCAACGGVAEPSEWGELGGPPLRTGEPDPDMVLVPAAGRRLYSWWHEPGCAWLAAWRLAGDS